MRLFRLNRRGGAARRGFSLAELMVVLAVIAITAAIGMPRYASAIGRHRADMAARRVMADLEYARATARAVGASRTVTFDVVAVSYTMASVASLDRRSSSTVVVLGAEPYKATISSASFGGAAKVTFDGFGRPNAGGTVVIRVGDVARTITLDADGKAKVS
jgi:type IV fimbrial biogenesis protein FimT